MFALRNPVTDPQTADISGAVARVLRQRSAPGSDGSEPGVAGACNAALAILSEALDVLAQASGHVRTAASHVIEAASAEDAERALLAERYDDARQRVDGLLEGASEGAASLLKPGAEVMAVQLTGATYAVSPFPLSTDEYGLDLPPPQQGFVSHAEVADTLRRVEVALERISRAKAVYEEDRTFLGRRAAQG